MQSDEEARLRTANRTKKTKRMLRRRIISKRELEFMKKKKKTTKNQNTLRSWLCCFDCRHVSTRKKLTKREMNDVPLHSRPAASSLCKSQSYDFVSTTDVSLTLSPSRPVPLTVIYC